MKGKRINLRQSVQNSVYKMPKHRSQQRQSHMSGFGWKRVSTETLLGYARDYFFANETKIQISSHGRQKKKSQKAKPRERKSEHVYMSNWWQIRLADSCLLLLVNLIHQSTTQKSQ